MAKKKGEEFKVSAEKYGKNNLAIDGTFEDVIKASFLSKPKPQPGDEYKAIKAKKEAQNGGDKVENG